MAVDPTPYYQDIPSDKPAAEGSSFRAGRFRTVADLKDIKPPGYNIDGLLQQRTTALLWGLPGTTKTTHAVDWWARLALGLDWCGASVTKGCSFYLPLEDRAGFRARIDAWEEHNETTLPTNALWWDGDFDFNDECVAAVRQAMQKAQAEHDMPVVFFCLDPIMAAYGEGTALDEQDFRKRLTAIDKIMAPFPDATALAIQHSGWDGKHELGSILQRALTATSIKAAVNGDIATLTIVRQKNDEEGKVFPFRKHPIGGKGKLVMIPDESGGGNARQLTGQIKVAYDALVRTIDDGRQANTTLPPLSGGLSARCPVDLWKAEFKRFKSDGAEMKADSFDRTFRRLKGELKKLGAIGFYDNYAWIIWEDPDKADNRADN
jgi:hypothetical protein